MTFHGVLLRFAFAMLWAFSTIAQPDAQTETPHTTLAAVLKNVTNASVHTTHTTSKHNNKGLLDNFNVDSSMIQRALYVLIGITTFGVLYFIVRAVRLKKTTHSRKKYGLLSKYNMEMDQMSSDEDETVYEARSLKR